MNEQDKEQLKREWKAYLKSNGVPHMIIAIYIPDWWLSLIDSLLAAKVAAMEEKKEKAPEHAGYSNIEGAMYAFSKGLNKGLDLGISIIKGGKV